MRHFLFGLIGVVVIGGAMCSAQTAADVNEGCRLTQDVTPGDYTFAWWGKNGHTYFIQQSDDLVTWSYVPVIESGAAAVTEYGFHSTGARFFLRLRHTDAATGGNPDTADFDGDLLTNWQELFQFHTDPYNTDSDGDTYSDSNEIMNGTDPNNAQNFPVDELPASQAEDGLVESVPNLFSQRKYVDDNWWFTNGEGNVNSFDNVGNTWSFEHYQSGGPKWAAKLALLNYPPGLELSETWNGMFPEASALLYTDATRGFLNLQRVRGALISPASKPVQPWPVTRHCLKVRATRLSSYGGYPTGSAVDENLGFVSVTIPQGQRISPTMPELSIEPVTGKSIILKTSPVEFRRVYGQLPDLPQYGIDFQIYPPWKMLPAGEDSTFQVNCNIAIATPVFFKATGGGVTPPMDVATAAVDNLTFAGGADDSDDGQLTVGVGTTFSDNDPVLRFSVKTRKTLKVTVHPIGLLSSGVTTMPQHLPTQESLTTLLNETFGVQANIYSEVTIKPTKVVAWDVGVETVPGGGTPKGAGDGVLDLFYHASPSQSLYSDEELRIAAAESSDDAADVNVFFVAAPGISIGVLNWGLSIRERLSAGQYKGYSIPLGFAGKAIPLNSNVIYVWDYPPDDEDDPNRSRPSEHGWGIAHEIGHVLGLAHCCGIGAFPPFERPNSDNESRLMTGRSGKKRFDNPRVLIKEEWDVIHSSTVFDD